MIMRFLETRIPAPFVTIAIAGGMWLLPHAQAMPDAIDVVRLAAIDLSMNLSAVVALAAFAGFWKARTTINPLKPDRASVLVTHGIYRFTRNPMYLSLLLLLVAYACDRGSWVAFAGPAVYVAYITRFQIVPEERILSSKFGDDFVAYKRRVRRWI
jgi:protein-S-isoprenylcysteine O-methyltransferase Ste14